MAWVILVLSGILEAVWAVALGESDGLRRRVPTVVFVLALIGSMIGLALAMGTVATGTAYAVWVGIGASLTVLWAMIRRQEAATMGRLVLLALLVGSVVGLKVVS
ncbi:multidrug efflux SMR transporter [Mycobacterium sp. SA01]|uniref:DMT family transporter n=1 Tax=Mycobacterium sp. SA01 TaxID=3238820 RepID=UPI00351AE24F